MKLVIPSLTEETAIKIAEDFYGSMMWRNDNGVLKSYPTTDDKPVEIHSETEPIVEADADIQARCDILQRVCVNCVSETCAIANRTA